MIQSTKIHPSREDRIKKNFLTRVEGNIPSILSGCIEFTESCIKSTINMANMMGDFYYLNMVLIVPFVNKGSDSSICESIDEISKQEIEDSKKNLNSKLTDIDYETYIKQFWVGLIEGDGTITVSCSGPNHVKVRMIISIKNI